MMLSCQEDTVIPWDSYTQWDHLVSKQKKNKPNVWDSDFLILPSIAFNPFQNTKKIGLSGEEFAFFTLKRNRFHFPAPTTEVSLFIYNLHFSQFKNLNSNFFRLEEQVQFILVFLLLIVVSLV